LSSPEPPKALLPSQSASALVQHTLPKLTPKDYDYLLRYFKPLLWLSKSDPQEEPVIQADDDLITRRFIEPTSKSRFYAFISVNWNGYYACLIRHAINKGGRQIDCNRTFKADKDALAHVCDYFGYKAYKCQGKTEEGKTAHPAW
jgi:hypothetical protein